MKMQCPICRRDLIANVGGWDCPEHGMIDQASLTSQESGFTPQTVQPLSIFLSYGHEPPDHVEVALRIKADLEARGHEVWFDIEKLRVPLDWEREIEQAIVGCDRVVLLMTPHSVRRADRRAAADDPAARDGYCLNEIAKAVERNKTIVPIMLAWVDQGPPTSICRIQWLDMQDCVPLAEKEQTYAQSKFPLLVEAIESNRLNFEGGWAKVWRHLKPLDFQVEMERHIVGFHGREWLLGADGTICRWLDDPGHSRVFWLVGGPGVGKSAIATQLAHRRGDVAAVHFCVDGHADFTNPNRALLSIAYQIATHLPAYHRLLQELDLREEAAKSAATLFRNLLVTPLSKLQQGGQGPTHPMLVVIDALDEATVNGKNELAAVIASQWDDTPTWLRLLVTSRSDATVVSQLQCLQPFVLDADRPENLADLRAYLEESLTSTLTHSRPELVSRILNKSEGLFLYIKTIVDEIRAGRLSVDESEAFPHGLAGYFQQFFDRQFAEAGIATYQQTIRPVVEVIVAQREALPLALLCEGTKLDDFMLRQQILPQLGALFPVRPSRGGPGNDTIAPFHKSVADWLTGRNEVTGMFRAGSYAVDRLAGSRVLAEACWREYKAGVDAMSPYSLRHLPAHLIAAGRWDELEVLAESAVTTDDTRLASVGIEALSFLQQSEQTLGLADAVIGRVGCCLNVALERTLPTALASALRKAIQSEEGGAGPASSQGLLDSLYVVLRYLGTMAIAEVAQQTLHDNASVRGKETVFQALRGGTLADNLEIFRDVYWRDHLVARPVLHLLRDIPTSQMRKLQNRASDLITRRLDHFAGSERADTDRMTSEIWSLFAVLIPLSRIHHINEAWGKVSDGNENHELFKEKVELGDGRLLRLWPWSLVVDSALKRQRTFFLDAVDKHTSSGAHAMWIDYLTHQRIRTKEAGPSQGPTRYQWLFEIEPDDLELVV